MSESDNIAKWLHDRGSFIAGLLLLQQAGDQRLHRELQQWASRPFVPPSARRRLEDRLRQLAGQEEKTMIRAPQEILARRHRLDEPESVTQLRQQGRLLKKREAKLHAEMCVMATQPESQDRQEKLYDLAKQIMKIEFELDRVYGDLRRWEEGGAAPLDNRQQVIEETVEKMKKRESIRTGISRLRSMLKKDSLAADQQRKLEKDLLDKQVQYDQLNHELGLTE